MGVVVPGSRGPEGEIWAPLECLERLFAPATWRCHVWNTHDPHVATQCLSWRVATWQLSPPPFAQSPSARFRGMIPQYTFFSACCELIQHMGIIVESCTFLSLFTCLFDYKVLTSSETNDLGTGFEKGEEVVFIIRV